MNPIRFKLLLLPFAAALAGGAAQPAFAFTLTPSPGLFTTTPGAVTFATFDGTTPVDATYATITGGVPNGGADPGAGGNWLFANSMTAPGLVTINFTGLQSYFGLYWGANDGVFNKIWLYNGAQWLGTVTGTGDPSAGTGEPNGYWNITAGPGQAFDRIELGFSTFEVDNLAVAAVPEPATWALMALGALPLVGALRRRVRGG